MSLRVGMVIFQENIYLLNELCLQNRGNFWDAPMENESKIIQKMFI